MTDRELLKETISLIYNAGIFDSLPSKIQHMIIEDEDLAKHIAKQEGPSMDLRLSCMEYEQHIMRLLRVNQTQEDFYKAIVKVVYLMMISEKNPMAARHIKDSTMLDSELLTIVNT